MGEKCGGRVERARRGRVVRDISCVRVCLFACFWSCLESMAYNPEGKASGGECGPLGWIKKKVEGLKSRNPELFSFVAGCAAGAVLIAGTAIVRHSCAESSGGSGTRKKQPKGPKVKVAIQEGETLGDILVKYVGDYTEDNLNMIKKLNKEIKDLDLIQPGQVIEVIDLRGLEESEESAVPASAPATKVVPKAEKQKQKKKKKKESSSKKQAVEKSKKKPAPQKKKGGDDVKEAKKEEKKRTSFWGRKKTPPTKVDEKESKKQKAKAKNNAVKASKRKLPQDKW